MTYDQILYFITVVEKEGFKAASESLYKSQPSLSVAIKKLEQELGITLFDRNHYRPRLTPAGEAFYRQARNTLKNFQELEQLGKDLGGGIESEISMAIDAVTPLDQLGPFLHHFFSERSTKLNLSVEVLEGALYKLGKHEAQLAITPMLKEDSQFHFHPFVQVKMLPVISKYLIKEKMEHHHLMALPQIIVKSSGPTSSQNYGVEEGKLWHVTDHSLKSYMIHNSLGWGRLPEHLVGQSLERGELVTLEHLGIRSLSFDLCLARHKIYRLGKTGQELWDRLIKLSS